TLILELTVPLNTPATQAVSGVSTLALSPAVPTTCSCIPRRAGTHRRKRVASFGAIPNWRIPSHAESLARQPSARADRDVARGRDMGQPTLQHRQSEAACVQQAR